MNLNINILKSDRTQTHSAGVLGILILCDFRTKQELGDSHFSLFWNVLHSLPPRVASGPGGRTLPEVSGM